MRPPSSHTPKRNRSFEEIEADKQAQQPKKPKASKGLPSFEVPRILKYRPKPWVLYGGISLILLILLTIVNTYQSSRICSSLKVSVKSSETNAFLKEDQVKKIIAEGYSKPIIGQAMQTIELAKVETALKASPYVEDAQVFKSFQDYLNIEVTLREPIARVMNTDGTSLYIDKNGIKFPTTYRHSSYVPLIRGNFSELLMPVDSFHCQLLERSLPVLKYIHSQPFWDAQISEVYITAGGDMIFYPQVGNTYIEFGGPNRIEDKFANLRLFYDQVITEVGWNQYKGVSIKYRGQVVGKR